MVSVLTYKLTVQIKKSILPEYPDEMGIAWLSDLIYYALMTKTEKNINNK